jgi:hypothetical protein
VTAKLNYQPVEEATWLSPIVIVLKKNGKLRIYVDFMKLNKATKKNPYFLPFFDEILNIINFRQVIRIWNKFS